MYVTTRALSVRVKCARVYSCIMYCMSVNVKYAESIYRKYAESMQKVCRKNIYSTISSL